MSIINPKGQNMILSVAPKALGYDIVTPPSSFPKNLYVNVDDILYNTDLDKYFMLACFSGETKLNYITFDKNGFTIQELTGTSFPNSSRYNGVLNELKYGAKAISLYRDTMVIGANKSNYGVGVCMVYFKPDGTALLKRIVTSANAAYYQGAFSNSNYFGFIYRSGTGTDSPFYLDVYLKSNPDTLYKRYQSNIAFMIIGVSETIVYLESGRTMTDSSITIYQANLEADSSISMTYLFSVPVNSTSLQNAIFSDPTYNGLMNSNLSNRLTLAKDGISYFYLQNMYTTSTTNGVGYNTILKIDFKNKTSNIKELGSPVTLGMSTTGTAAYCGTLNGRHYLKRTDRPGRWFYFTDSDMTIREDTSIPVPSGNAIDSMDGNVFEFEFIKGGSNFYESDYVFLTRYDSYLYDFSTRKLITLENNTVIDSGSLRSGAQSKYDIKGSFISPYRYYGRSSKPSHFKISGNLEYYEPNPSYANLYTRYFLNFNGPLQIQKTTIDEFSLGITT